MTHKFTPTASQEGATSSFALKLVEAVLKPLLGSHRGNLTQVKNGDNAISFEVNGLPADFAPQAGTVVASVKPQNEGISSKGSRFYLVDIKGYLVQLSAHPLETPKKSTVAGAIYTGNDRDTALRHALRHAKRLSVV